ncbi:S-adenosylmethionine decarboxylase proenzyme 1-like isoform X2 [Lineus longissimus]
MDAYILSESSMFVSKNRFILKTCGSTTLLKSIKPLLLEATEKCGFEVMDLFYSRKNFMKPELQHNIHQTFDDEVCHLDESFENGAAYALGRLNGECWYFYTIDTLGVMEPDQTLELLMTDLDPAVMEVFSMKCCKTGEECTEKSGISKLVPGSVIDAYLFDPYGYSCNGLLEDDHYFTIHVTPQPNCSYVSFETNVPQDDFKVMIEHVLDCFRPGKFLVTLFANKASRASDSLNAFKVDNPVPGYCNQDWQHSKFRNYDLLYAHFMKPRFRTPSDTEPALVQWKKPHKIVD